MVVKKHVSVLVVLLGWGGKASSSRLCLLSFVLCVFFLWASMCPMAVASSEGGNLVKLVSFSPVNGGRKPFCNAIRRVDMAGENSAAWANVTRSAGVLECLLITGAAWRFV